MSKSIRFSEKHGVNPSLLVCLVCGKDTGVALVGRLPYDKEAHRKMSDRGPCEACEEKFEEYKAMGFLLFIIFDEYETASSNKNKPTPWQFFHSLSVLKHEAMDRIFKNIDKSHGCAFISLSVAKKCQIVNEDGSIKETK